MDLQQQQIRPRILNLAHGIGMNLNHVIGSGIVTAPGIIWASVKSPSVVFLLWVVGAIVSMAGSLLYVEHGVRNGKSGGETRYLHTAYPRPRDMVSYIFSFMYIL